MTTHQGGGDGPVMRVWPPDDVYNDIRHLNFSELGAVLGAKVRALDESYDQRKTDDRLL